MTVPDDNEYAFEWLDEHWVARRSADDWLAGEAAEALAKDPLVHGRRLEILVQNGVVILTGELASPQARAAAGRRAWSVEGVTDVCNRVTVDGL
jgi:osmotically-inducible protein OsmY